MRPKFAACAENVMQSVLAKECTQSPVGEQRSRRLGDWHVRRCGHGQPRHKEQGEAPRLTPLYDEKQDRSVVMFLTTMQAAFPKTALGATGRREMLATLLALAMIGAGTRRRAIWR